MKDSAFPLHVFLPGRRVVVVGGGRVATRRVEALLAVGAVVTVVSPTMSGGLRQRHRDGRLHWLPRPYRGVEDLAGCWLVLTATGVPAVDARVSADAAAQTTWCIDAGDADRSSAWMPAVSRTRTPEGEWVVGVTTGDPGRSVRIRDRISHLVIDASVRGLRSRRAGQRGWVALVGGGPGDPGLLTQRGRALLAQADVVVLDRLAPRGVLGALDDDVEVIEVGKAPGDHLIDQEDINALLVDRAGRGRAVVRLKGGDPYVLGRGGEERLACEQAGITVEVVPGVTSAVSVPAAAGIPVTHRGLARGFTVVTAHDQLAEVPVVDDHTIVLLMGVRRLPAIVARLTARGLADATPAAIVESGFSPTQRVTVAPLRQLPAAAARAGARSPAVIVIGQVVTLAPAWSERSAASGSEVAS